jgi:uncharacterized phage protein gp47/JayE
MTLDPCGCCELPVAVTPIVRANRPGLSILNYRIGTFATFRQAMLQAIASTPGLAPLRTRLSDDYSITLLELWAIIADILTFYQQQIANEAFLRTTTQRDSVLRLARLLDYQLRPGVAATVYLAFMVNQGKQVEIPVGLKVQSVAAQDQPPQKFETLEAITAEARYNQLRIYPPPVAFNPLAAGRTEAILARTLATVSLAPADRLILFNDNTTTAVEEQTVAGLHVEEDRLILRWNRPLNSTWTSATQVYKLGRSFRLFGYNAPATYVAPSATAAAPTQISWRLRTTPFNYPQAPEERPPLILPIFPSRLCLDARYDGLSVGQTLLVDDSTGLKKQVVIHQIDQVQVTLRATPMAGEPPDAVGALTDTVTRVWVFPPLPTFDRRTIVISELLGEPLEFWQQRYASTLSSDTVYLPGRQINDAEGVGVEVDRTIERNQFQAGVILRPAQMAIGQTVLLTDATGQAVLSSIKATPTLVPGTDEFCHLAIPLEVESLSLETASAVLLGNVALASHGETVREEIVGDGNAAASFQRFELRKQPVTYVPSPMPSGVVTSLRVLVDRVLWQEVTSLYDREPTETIYTTRIADDGTLTLQFGDGVTGARLPSGQGNVVATYRQGVGLAGRVGAHTLTTLLDRPVGLKSVTNPLAAEGGADPESLDQARQNAPTTVRTFGRSVSLQDFEDLVTGTGEVAKASATWVWNGDRRVIHLTVAGQQGSLFSSEALSRIHASLNQQRDLNYPLQIANFVRIPMVITAKVQVVDTYITADVGATVLDALLTALSFDALPFAQPIHLSDIYRILQTVTGVAWVDIDQLQFKNPSILFRLSRGATLAPVQDHLRIYPARSNPNPPPLVLPAEQAWIESPQDIQLIFAGGLLA